MAKIQIPIAQRIKKAIKSHIGIFKNIVKSPNPPTLANTAPIALTGSCNSGLNMYSLYTGTGTPFAALFPIKENYDMGYEIFIPVWDD